MFLSKNEEGKVVGVTKISQMIIGIFAIVSMVFGAYMFIHSNLCTEMDNKLYAKELLIDGKIKAKEIEIVQTLQEQQKVYEKDIEKKDLELLDIYRNQIYILKKELKENPDDDSLIEKIEILQRKIEKLETKLYS